MAVETSQSGQVEHFPDKNAEKIQNAIAILSDMESKLDELGSQVSEMKRKLIVYAETEGEATKSEIIEQAKKEAESATDSVKKAAAKEAEAIAKKGESETEALRKRIEMSISQAVDLIVSAVQSV
ncbi:MAG: hypothetical protein JRN52_05555 [Nitrososphaerota archaeon]|nr:hypothetical protein [Nitrososphaerota archaeon]